MTLIKEMIHPDLAHLNGRILRRQAARGIVLRGESILLLFTERYNDFSFPGGGVDPGEDTVTGLQRELAEETGAQDINVQQNLGFIEEYRPHWKPEYDLMHMTSHFYQCTVAPALAAVKMEHYEVANGMRPVWVNLQEALQHNQGVMARAERSMGLSIVRKTFMLDWVKRELLETAAV
ncbi:MAG: NUDIX domain-containing protein [Halomonadaceae bacterium]|nr:MAG: NUDIX domain-containing protein [Halomonadaceae bacterium]